MQKPDLLALAGKPFVPYCRQLYTNYCFLSRLGMVLRSVCVLDCVMICVSLHAVSNHQRPWLYAWMCGVPLGSVVQTYGAAPKQPACPTVLACCNAGGLLARPYVSLISCLFKQSDRRLHLQQTSDDSISCPGPALVQCTCCRSTAVQRGSWPFVGSLFFSVQKSNRVVRATTI